MKNLQPPDPGVTDQQPWPTLEEKWSHTYAPRQSSTPHPGHPRPKQRHPYKRTKTILNQHNFLTVTNPHGVWLVKVFDPYWLVSHINLGTISLWSVWLVKVFLIQSGFPDKTREDFIMAFMTCRSLFVSYWENDLGSKARCHFYTCKVHSNLLFWQTVFSDHCRRMSKIL